MPLILIHLRYKIVCFIFVTLRHCFSFNTHFHGNQFPFVFTLCSRAKLLTADALPNVFFLISASTLRDRMLSIVSHLVCEMRKKNHKSFHSLSAPLSVNPFYPQAVDHTL